MRNRRGYFVVVLGLVMACRSSADEPARPPTTSEAGANAAYSGDCKPNLACRLDAPPSSGDPHQDCVDRINQFRTQCACLAPLERWRDGEACADQMAAHDEASARAHDGFISHVCSPGGNAQNECPGYAGPAEVAQRCLQLMWDEGPAPSATCSGSCFQQHGHFINMTSDQYKRVACGFSALTAGSRLWSVQNFSP